jgi:hypothetical protein
LNIIDARVPSPRPPREMAVSIGVALGPEGLDDSAERRLEITAGCAGGREAGVLLGFKRRVFLRDMTR